MMINKFPKLNEKQKAELNKWLDTQIDVYKSDALSYRACGNEDEYIKHIAYCYCMDGIKVYLEYHMEE